METKSAAKCSASVKAAPSKKTIEVKSKSNKPSDIGDQLTLIAECKFIDGGQGCVINEKIEKIDKISIKNTKTCEYNPGNLDI